MIRMLTDEEHERLWRICTSLLEAPGVRAALVCDAASGALILSVGDALAEGTAGSVEALGPGESVVRGEAGQMYGVDLAGGTLLAVLHAPGALEQVRVAAAEAAARANELLATIPEAPPPREHHHAAAPQVAKARVQKKRAAVPAPRKAAPKRPARKKTAAAPRRGAAAKKKRKR